MCYPSILSSKRRRRKEKPSLLWNNVQSKDVNVSLDCKLQVLLVYIFITFLILIINHIGEESSVITNLPKYQSTCIYNIKTSDVSKLDGNLFKLVFSADIFNFVSWRNICYVIQYLLVINFLKICLLPFGSLKLVLILFCSSAQTVNDI